MGKKIFDSFGYFIGYLISFAIIVIVFQKWKVEIFDEYSVNMEKVKCIPFHILIKQPGFIEYISLIIFLLSVVAVTSLTAKFCEKK